MTFNSDQFAMFNVADAAQRTRRPRWPRRSMNPTFQSAFNVVKGSVPARTDVPNDAFDDCGKKGMADLAEANGQRHALRVDGAWPCGAGLGEERDL